jgi:hypothetical protein
VPLEASCQGEALRSLGASGAKVKRACDFFVEAICEPYVREEEARMMNGR